MNDDLEKELDKNRFSIVKYSIYINILVFAFVSTILFLLKVQNVSILLMVWNYYFR